MKTIIIILLLFNTAFAQFTIDSTGVEKVSESLDVFWCRGHYEGVIGNGTSINDYTIGFLYGIDRDNLNYVPMGWYNHNASTKTVTFKTEMANLPREKIWVQGYVLPISNKSKYLIGGTTYTSNGRNWYYDIYQEPYLETNLPSNTIGLVGETVTFTIYATGQSLQYQWYRRTMNPDTTWNDPIAINEATSNEYTTPTLSIQYNGWKIFCKVYNNIGEVYSRQCLLRVVE